jgi:hypothetical protein
MYLLVPHDPTLPFRMFRNFGLVEQVMKQTPGDWCSVLGYTSELDECPPVWLWRKRDGTTISREAVTQSPSESLLPIQ